MDHKLGYMEEVRNTLHEKRWRKLVSVVRVKRYFTSGDFFPFLPRRQALVSGSSMDPRTLTRLFELSTQIRPFSTPLSYRI